VIINRITANSVLVKKESRHGRDLSLLLFKVMNGEYNYFRLVIKTGIPYKREKKYTTSLETIVATEKWEVNSNLKI
jgi:hypothetical protein